MRRLSPDEKISLERDMESARRTRIKLERRKNASFLERNLGYPLVVLIILALTGLAFLLVSMLNAQSRISACYHHEPLYQYFGAY